MPRAARSRIPPENGMTSLFIAATDGKRADSADQARSACAWLANAPSWITLPSGRSASARGQLQPPWAFTSAEKPGFGTAFGGLGHRRFRNFAEVELCVLVLAGAGLERRFALAGDVQPAWSVV